MYAADMSAGNWTECPSPILFFADGEVADGQHRLFAVVESQTTQQFLVTRNFPRDAALNIDNGRPRTLIDNARIAEIDADVSFATQALTKKDARPS
jgi:hypothetical protein